MDRKGFTLIEVLAVIVIIGLLGGIAIIAVRSVLKTGDEKYYNNLENNMLLAGHDYFTDHRDKLPFDNDVNFVELSVLESEKYVEEFKDVKGNKCTTGRVYIYRENNQYAYEACLTCGEYHSVGKYCDGGLSNKIYMIAKTKDTHQDYDILTTYNSALYVDENVDVTFSMDNKKAVKYTAVNTKTNASKSCDENSNPPYTVDIDESGTYKVTAYDKDNQVIAANQYFNVRIAKNGPAFTISGNEKFLMKESESACLSNNVNPKKQVTFTIVKGNINDEYSSIRYQINNGEEKPINKLNITEDLESGHYVLRVIISNFAGGESVVEKEFDVAYLVDVEYDDGNYAGNSKTHEVVSGKTYNYLSLLPAKKLAYGKELDVRWHLNDELFNPEIKTVEEKCTHKIIGKMSIPVPVPNFVDYCADVTYNGSKQTITTSAPAHITFKNNEKTNAGEYTVTALIDEPQYIWQNANGTYDFNNKTFKCSISKADNEITITSKTYTYDGNGKETTVNATNGTPSVTYYSDSSCKTKTTATNATSAGGTPKNAGTYYAIATVAESENYNKGDSECQKAVVINKAEATFSCSDKTYDGNQKTGCTCTNCTMSGTNTATNAGGPWKVTATANANYSLSTTQLTWKINKATLTCPSQATSSKTYTGNPITFGGNACPKGSSRTDASETNAGTYYSICTPDSNHQFSDTCNPGKLTINRKATTSSLSSKSGSVCNGDGVQTITITTDGDGALSCTTSNEKVATCTISGKKLKVTPKSKTGSSNTSATITVKQAEGTNYQAAKDLTYKISTGRCWYPKKDYSTAKVCGQNCQSDYCGSKNGDWACSPKLTVCPGELHQQNGWACWCFY